MEKNKKIKICKYKSFTILIFVFLVIFPIKILLAYNSEKTTERVMCNDGDIVCLINDSLSLVKKNIPDFSNLDNQFEIKSTEIPINKKINLTATVADISLPLSSKVSTNNTSSFGSSLTSVADDIAYGWNFFIKGLINNFVETKIALNQVVIGTDNTNTDIIIPNNNTSKKTDLNIPSSKKETLKIAQTQIIPPATQITKTETKVIQGSQGPQGLAGLVGPQGPKGESGKSIDVSNFVSEVFFSRQVSRIFDSISKSIKGLSESLADEVETKSLIVSGDANINGDLTITGNLTGNVVGVINPSFTLGSIPFQGVSGLTEDNTNLFWDSANSRLGVGTSTPTEKLNVAGNISATGSIISSNLSGTNTGDETNSSIKTKLGVATNLIDGYLSSTDWTTFNNKQPAGNYLTSSNLSGLIPYIGGNTNVDLGLHNLTVDTNTFFVDSVNHRVGVGTTTPSQALEVNGTAKVSMIYFGNTNAAIRNSGANVSFLSQDTNSYSAIYTGGEFMFGNNKITAAGVSGWVSTTNPAASPLDSGFSRGAANKIYVGNGTQGDYSGTLIAENVGIGITNPSTALHVVGAVTATSYGVFSGTVINGTDGLYYAANQTGKYAFGAATVNGARPLNLYSGDATRNDGYINLLTAGVERLRVDGNGNVGIGTTGPTQKLEVEGNVLIGNDSTDSHQLLFSNSQGAVFFDGSSRMILGSASGRTLAFRTGGFGSDSLTRMLIDNTGNVGIGTTLPTAILDIKTPAGFTRALRIGPQTINDGDGAYIEFTSSNTDTYGAQIGGIREASAGYNALVFRTGQATQTERMRITNAGNVGIGTTTPTYPLEINTTGDNALKITNVGSAPNAIFLQNQGALIRWSNGSYFSNTGVYSGSSDQSYKTYDGANVQTRLFINATNGNVGIGTTVPTTKFYVNDNASTSLGIKGITLKNDSTLDYLNIWNYNANNYAIQSADEINYRELLLNPFGGNVGIGTTTPLQKLQINEGNIFLNAASHNTDLALGFGTAGTIYHELLSNRQTGEFRIWSGAGGNGHFVTFWSDNVESMRLRGGNMGVGTTNPLALLQITQPTTGVGNVTTNGTTALVGSTTQFLNTFKVGDTITVSGETARTIDTITDNTHLTVSVAFSTSGASKTYTLTGGDRFVVKGNGNVGIGTTNPLEKLHIAAGNLMIENGQSINFRRPSWGNIAGIYANYTTNLEGYLIFQTNNGSVNSEKMRIDKDGNVGIGTATPTANLDVLGNIKSSSTIAFGGNGRLNHAGSGATSYVEILNQSIGGVRFKNSLIDLMSVDNLGNVGIGTIAPGNKLHIQNTLATPQILLKLDSDSATDGSGEIIHFTTSTDENVGVQVGGYRDASGGTGSLRFSTYLDGRNPGLQEAMRITGSGNVGIGTTSPQNALDINGRARFIGDSTNATSGFGVEIFQQGGTNAYIQSFDRTAAVFKPLNIQASSINLMQGNVGIGTTAPGALLHVGSANPSIRYTQINSNGQLLVNYNNNGDVIPITLRNMDQSSGISHSITQDIYFARTTSSTPISAGYFKFGKEQEWTTTNTTNDSFLSFGLTLDAVTSEKMRITSAGNVGIGTTTPSQQLEITKNFRLPATIGATPYGIIYKDGIPFIHDFSYGLNGNGITPVGGNIFLGNAGNFTMGSTAVSSSQASYNSAFGTGALGANTTGSFNLAQGAYSLQNNTTGDNNSANGVGSLLSNTTGNYNIAMGRDSGRYLSDGTTGRTTGNNGLYLGYNSKASANGTDNEIVIGYNAIGQGSNTVTLGNTNVTKTLLNGNVGIGTLTPSSKLDVVGSGRFVNSTGTSLLLSNNGYNLGGGQALRLYDGRYTFSIGWGSDTTDSSLSMDNNGLHVNVQNAAFGSGNKNLILQDFAGVGNVGIGTTSPSDKLSVLGGISAISTNYKTTLSASDSGNGSLYTSSPLFNFNYWNGSAVVTAFSYNNSGNVGIGTTSPLSKLNINGGVGTLSTGLSFGDGDTGFFELADDNLIGIIGGTNKFRLTYNYLDLFNNAGVRLSTVTPSATIPNILPVGGNDSDTGIGWAGADILSLIAGGVNGLNVDGSGNVGIGTTNPSNILTAGFSSNSTTQSNSAVLNIFNSDSTVNNMANISFGQSGSSSNGFSRLGVINTDRTSGSEDQDMFLGTIGGGIYEEKIRITSVGNVGIGTINPTARLEVLGFIKVPDNRGLMGTSYGENTLIPDYSTGGHFNRFRALSGQIFETYSGGTYNEKMRLTDVGNLGIGTTNPIAKLQIGPGGSDTTLSFNLGATNTYSSIQSYNSSLALNPSGNNVGIGTTSPSELLDIAGISTAGTSLRLYNNSTAYGDRGIIKFNGNTAGGGNTNTAMAQIVGGHTSAGNINYLDFKVGAWNNNNTISSTMMRINSLGNVGIGTTSPAGKLNVATTAGDNNIYADDYSTNTGHSNYWFSRRSHNATLGTLTTTVTGEALGAFYFQGVDAAGNFDYGARMVAVQNGTAGSYVPTDLIFYTQSAEATNTNQLVLSNTGNVGIGTTSPTSKLYVDNGDISIGGATSSLQGLNFYENNGKSMSFVYDGVDNSLNIRDENNLKLVSILRTGNVGIGTTSPGSKFEVVSATGGVNSGIKLTQLAEGVAASSYAPIDFSVPTTGLVGQFLATANNYSNPAADLASNSIALSASVGQLSLRANSANGFITLHTNGARRMTIDSSGNVGIGTTTPTLGKLQIEGAAGSTLLSLNNTNANWGMSIDSNTIPNFYIGSVYNSTYAMANYFWRANWNTAGVAHNTFQNPSTGVSGLTVMELKQHFTGDTGDYLNITSNGGTSGNLLTVDKDGNVGIGTTAPGGKLHVEGGKFVVNSTNSSYGQIQVTNPSVGEATIVLGAGITSGWGGTLVSSNSNYLWAFGPGSYGNTPDKFIIGNNGIGGSALSVLAPSGNVGIGTSTPVAKLDIQGGNVRIGNTIGGDTLTVAGNISVEGAGGPAKMFTTSFYNPNGYAFSYWTGSAVANAIQWDSTPRVSIPNGNLGIGTTSPATALDVLGQLNLKATSSQIFGIRMQNRNATQSWVFGTDATVVDDGKFYLAKQSSAPSFSIDPNFNVWLGGASTTNPTMAVQANGNVGIGTTTPLATLQVNTPATNSAGNGIRINRPGSTYYSGLEYTTNGTVDWAQGVNSAGFGIYEDGQAATTRLLIQDGGNVGIGTTSPNYKLQVSGGDINLDNNRYLSAFSSTGVQQAIFSLNSANKIIFGGGGQTSAMGFDINGGSEDMTLTSTGLGIGTTAPTGKLHVVGSSVVATDIIKLSAGSGTFFVNNVTSNSIGPIIDYDINASATITNFIRLGNGTMATGVTNGITQNIITSTPTIATVSNGTTFNVLNIAPTINQTGTANGITRGIYVNPTLTAASDFRAIETNVVSGTGRYGYYGAGTAISYFGGNVGIGTTTPNSKLVVAGNIDPEGFGREIGLAYRYANIHTDKVSFAGASASYFIDATNISLGGATGLTIITHTNGNIFLAPNGGNVGIGTTAPATKLTVQQGTSVYSQLSAGLDMALGIATDTALIGGLDFKNFNSAGSVRFMARNDQNDYLSMNAPGSTVATTYFGITGSNTNLLFSQGATDTTKKLTIGTYNAGDLILGTNNTERMRILSTGNVGIGTTGPGRTLDVHGDVHVGLGTPSSYQSNHVVEITSSGSRTPLTVIGGSATFEAWVDITPSKAVMFGAAKPSTGADGNFHFSTFNGSSWADRMVIDNTNGGISVGSYSSTYTTAPSQGMIISGNVGIGNTNPSYQLQVGNNTVSGIVARFENSTGTCDINPTTASLACSSDISLKKNITTLENSEFILNENINTSSTSLEKILALTPVLYNWNNENDSINKHVGFIAQEVEQVFPDLVFTDQNTTLKSISYTNLIPYTVKAIQEMDLIVKDLSSLDTSKDNSLGSLIAQFLAEQATFAKEFTANIFHVNGDVCVDDVCITKEEFKLMLINAKGTANTDVATPEIEVTTTVLPPPVAIPPVEIKNPPVVENEIVTNPLIPIDTEPVITPPIETVTEPINDTTTVLSLPESPVSGDLNTMPSED